MAVAKTHNLETAYTGDTFDGFTVSGVTKNGAAMANTLASVRMQFRTAPDAAASSLELNSATSAITINNNTTWNFTVNKFVVTLDPDIYYYDVETTDSAATANVKTYMRGSWKVIRDVTR